MGSSHTSGVTFQGGRIRWSSGEDEDEADPMGQIHVSSSSKTTLSLKQHCGVSPCKSSTQNTCSNAGISNLFHTDGQIAKHNLKIFEISHI